jgi:hypothetical protein
MLMMTPEERIKKFDKWIEVLARLEEMMKEK